MLDPPIGAQPHYGAHLGDPGYWARYVVEVARTEALVVTGVEAPLVVAQLESCRTRGDDSEEEP